MTATPMEKKVEIFLIEDGDGIQLALEEGAGHRSPIGPRLDTRALGVKAREYVHELIDGTATAMGNDPIESFLQGAEQLALDGIYTGNRSTRDTAIARAVVLWATMAIRSLAERSRSASAGSVEDRLGPLVALAQGGQTDPLSLTDPAPIRERQERARDRTGIAGRIVAHIEASGARGSAGAAEEGQEIVLQPFQNRWAIFYEIAASIAFTTFASAGSFVFLGVRLQKCTGPCDAGGIIGFSASLDIIALVICSFGFLFATLSYANATGVLARLSTMSYGEALERGNRVSEYFGVYALIFAVPLAVEGATSSPIPFIVKLVGLIAFFGYHWAPRFSLIERVIGDRGFGSDRIRQLIVLFLLCMLAAAWFGPSIDGGDAGLWIRVAASALFLLATCFVYMIASLTPEQSVSSSYQVHHGDILSDESPSRTGLMPLSPDQGHE